MPPPRPRTLPLRPDNIPSSIRSVGRQFVLWRWELRKNRKGEEEWTKPPRQPSGRLAKSTDPDTWSTFEECLAAYAAGGYDGIGVALPSGFGLVGVDFDHCVDYESKRIDPEFKAMAMGLATYVEISPSGTGLRALLHGALPDNGRKKGPIEMYQDGKYVTLTGHRIRGVPEEVEERPQEILALHASVFGKPSANGHGAAEPASAPPAASQQAQEGDLDDIELMRRARAASNGTWFSRLYDAGDWSGYTSQSDADLALANVLAFWANGDPGRTDRLFRESRLMRPKWDESHFSGGVTYGARTVEKACERIQRTGGYDPKRRSQPPMPAPEPAPAPTEEPEPRAYRPAWPDRADDAAFMGLSGQVVDLVSKHCEADDMAVLLSFLNAFGAAAGRRPHFSIGASRHAAATYIGLVGESSRGRKGSAWAAVRMLFFRADPKFADRMISGLGSGERLVHLLRDAEFDENGKETRPAVPDKRLLITEDELGGLLTVVNRESSTLSAMLRSGWDGLPLRNEVKSDGAKASDYHLALMGHTTAEELRKKLSEQSARNGLGNRVLWACTRRARRIPLPEPFEGPDIDDLVKVLEERIWTAKTINRMRFTPEAAEIWVDWYENRNDDVYGIIAALGARAEPQVLRFAMIYALTDGENMIDVDHVRAAIALWDYSERSIGYIWGTKTGDIIADRIYFATEDGELTRTEINVEVFQRNVPAAQLETAIEMLIERGLIGRRKVANPSGTGRPIEILFRATGER